MAHGDRGQQKHGTAGHKDSGGGHAAAEGKKGVSQQTVGSGKEHDPNNFANDPARAAAAGRKGGHHSHDKS